MSQATNPLTDWFNLFNYFPTTNWQKAFSPTITPTINFGCNTEDVPVEQHVLDSVGSYGFQLNRVIDALLVIVDHSAVKKMSADDRQKITAFKELAQAADDSAKEFEGQLTETGVDKLIANMHSLQKADPELYEKFKDQIVKAL
jgi:hypothetical protein